MRDRQSVLSPTEAAEAIGKLERAIAAARNQIEWIERRTPAAAFEALVGRPLWRQLEGASGTWLRSPNEVRQGEVTAQARERVRLLDEVWIAERALEEARRQAADYAPEHARYDALERSARQLEQRVAGLMGMLLDPNRPPTDQELRAYVLAASELQDLSGALLVMSGARAQWGRLSETGPRDRFSPSMHARVLDRLPERVRGPWAWQQPQTPAMAGVTA